MKANAADIEKYLNNIGVPLCPLCNNRQWQFSDNVFQIVEIFSGNKMEKQTMMPVFPLTCSKCGNIYLINAKVAEIISSSSFAANGNLEKDSRKQEGRGHQQRERKLPQRFPKPDVAFPQPLVAIQKSIKKDDPLRRVLSSSTPKTRKLLSVQLGCPHQKWRISAHPRVPFRVSNKAFTSVKKALAKVHNYDE